MGQGQSIPEVKVEPGQPRGEDLLTSPGGALGFAHLRGEPAGGPGHHPCLGRGARVWTGRGGGLPGYAKTEGYTAQDGCPEQVSYAVLGLGQGDLLLQVVHELLGAEEGGKCR